MQTIEDRCDNWGRAMRGSSGGGSGAASAEGQYRSPQRSHWLVGSAPVTVVMVDIDDARRVEMAVCTLGQFHHTLLRAKHVYRASDAICWRLATRGSPKTVQRSSGLPDALQVGYRMLGAALNASEPTLARRLRELARTMMGPPMLAD